MATSLYLRHNPTRLLFLLPCTHTRLFSTHPNPNPNPSLATLPLLLSAIKSEPDPTRIAALIQSHTHLPLFHSHRPLFSLTLNKLRTRPDLILQTLSSLKSDPNLPQSEAFLTRILTLYSHSNLLESALKLFDEIPRKTNLSFSALLSALLHHKQYDSVIENFSKLPSQLKISPGLAAHNLYLKAIIAKGDVGAARKVLDEMAHSKKFALDIVSYSTVLEGILADKDEDAFDEIVQEIEKSGLEQDLPAYNCRILLLCGKGRSFRAEEVLEVMVAKGVRPDLTSFNAVICGFCKEGDVGSAVRVFKRMRVLKRVYGKDGASPNLETYSVLVKGLVEEGEFGLGVDICVESLVRRFAPPLEVVKGLVEGLVKNAKVEEAKCVVEKMRIVVKGDAAEIWKKFESSLAL